MLCEKIFLKSHPMVNITFFNQIWQSFTVKIPEGDSQEVFLFSNHFCSHTSLAQNFASMFLVSSLYALQVPISLSPMAILTPFANSQALLEQKMESGKSAQCCWHVCDLKIEQDTKMSENVSQNPHANSPLIHCLACLPDLYCWFVFTLMPTHACPYLYSHSNHDESR